MQEADSHRETRLISDSDMVKAVTVMEQRDAHSPYACWAPRHVRAALRWAGDIMRLGIAS